MSASGPKQARAGGVNSSSFDPKRTFTHCRSAPYSEHLHCRKYQVLACPSFDVPEVRTDCRPAQKAWPGVQELAIAIVQTKRGRGLYRARFWRRKSDHKGSSRAMRGKRATWPE